jgi:hypothetical protein
MLRTSDFVRPSDVLDPDQEASPTDKVDYESSGRSMGGSVLAMVCVLGMLALAVLQPHARNFSPTSGHSATPAAAVYPH